MILVFVDDNYERSVHFEKGVSFHLFKIADKANITLQRHGFYFTISEESRVDIREH